MSKYIGKHKTKVRTDDAKIFVTRYHDTDVFKYDCDNDSIVLDAGGWPTRTTMKRINQSFQEYSLPFHLRQRDGDWILLRTDTKAEATWDSVENLESYQWRFTFFLDSMKGEEEDVTPCLLGSVSEGWGQNRYIIRDLSNTKENK